MFRTVADHLLDRLVELGVRHVFGVAGEQNFVLLDRIEADLRVEWVGTATESGAVFAADGYARERGLGVVCAAAGQVSAALSGSAADRVPVLAVAGVASAGHAGHAGALSDGALADIDRVLAAILAGSQPGVLEVPVDVLELPAAPVRTPLRRTAGAHGAIRDAFAGSVAKLLAATSGRPVVLAGLATSRVGAQPSLEALLVAGDLDRACLPWGRSLVDDGNASFLGVYIGAGSHRDLRAAVETAACLVTVGVSPDDPIGEFLNRQVDPGRRIDIQPWGSTVAGRSFDDLAMGDALDVLVALVDRRPHPAPIDRGRPDSVQEQTVRPPLGPLTQDALWDAVVEWLRPGDLVLADHGTCYYGMADRRLPDDVRIIAPPIRSATGYALPALLGGALAAPDRRAVVLVGDGAAQSTAPELGTIIRHQIPGLVLIVDNGGRTTDRVTHRPNATYHDIGSWRWTDLPAALGASASRCRTARVDTALDLRAALDEAARSPDRLTLIQAVTGRVDVPPLLGAISRAAAADTNRASGRLTPGRSSRSDRAGR